MPPNNRVESNRRYASPLPPRRTFGNVTSATRVVSAAVAHSNRYTALERARVDLAKTLK
jgi:hypothetical protein